MTSAPEATAGNRARLPLVERVLSELLAEALRRGFYGSVGLELVIQDGTIQHVKRKVEKMER